MILLVNKPKGITSHDVVDRLRKITGERRVGHGGTLDPNATGLLIVGIGRESTKLLGSVARNTKKTYIAEIFLGEERDTDDVEGIPVRFAEQNGTKKPERQGIINILKTFEGEQMQTPPSYSAIKLKGKKAYEVARRGGAPVLGPRKVTVYSIKVVKYGYPILELELEVSSGTYIRAIARDLGKKLGTYGYLKELKRTKIGNYNLEDAMNLENITKKVLEEKGLLPR